ncbi:hypothetical protein GEMRC1_009856 [Eukaryota sp. GEM-RC1]
MKTLSSEYLQFRGVPGPSVTSYSILQYTCVWICFRSYSSSFFASLNVIILSSTTIFTSISLTTRDHPLSQPFVLRSRHHLHSPTFPQDHVILSSSS